MTHILRLRFALLLASVSAAACSGPSNGSAGPDAGPTAAEIWKELEACELTGDFRVEQNQGNACNEWPRLGERTIIERDGELPILRAGLLELPVIDVRGDCVFVAAGCKTSSDDFGERYLAPTLELSRSPEGITLAASAVDVERGYVGACSDASFTAKRIPDCDPLGSFEAPASAVIRSGSCELEWNAGQVEISLGEEGYDLAWGSTELRGLSLDPSTCTLSGDRGISDFWLYNNAMRHSSITLTIANGALQGQVSDALDSETFDGKSCAGATFELVAARAADREVERLAISCDIPQPVACGNGVCEEGESCLCQEDCGCEQGFECAPDEVCRAPCTMASEGQDCGAGERCSPIGQQGLAIFSSDPLFCEDEGSTSIGENCSSNSQCVAGAVCHYGERGTVARCAAACGEGFEQCSADAPICGSQGDGSGTGFYPTAVRACEHRAAIGEDCRADVCESGLSCLESCIDGVCEKYCTHSCSSGCPAELPVCGTIGVCMKNN